MGNMMGGGARRDAKRAASKAEGVARQREQAGNEETARARQRAERGGGGRGRDMLVGRLNKVLPSTLGGSE